MATLTTLSCSAAQFPPNMEAFMHWWTRRQQEMHFLATLLTMGIEIRFSIQIYVHFSEKAFLKSLSISNGILSKFGIRGTPDYQRVTSKRFSRTMGSEWPEICRIRQYDPRTAEPGNLQNHANYMLAINASLLLCEEPSKDTIVVCYISFKLQPHSLDSFMLILLYI